MHSRKSNMLPLAFSAVLICGCNDAKRETYDELRAKEETAEIEILNKLAAHHSANIDWSEAIDKDLQHTLMTIEVERRMRSHDAIAMQCDAN